MRQGKWMWLTPASLLMAIQISRVIERSSIWMPSARDVTRNRAITLPFLDASLTLSSRVSFSYCQAFRRPSSPRARRWVVVVFLFPMNDSIGSTLRPRIISARRVARAPNGRTLESAYHPETYARARSLAGASQIGIVQTGEKETRNLQLTSLITSCPHVVALLKSASRVYARLRLLNYLIAPRVISPQNGSRTSFVLDVPRSNGLNRFDFRLLAEINK